LCPLLVDIEADLGIFHTGAGSLFLYVTAGYFIGFLFSGYLGAMFNHQKTVTLSSLTCGLAMIAAAMGTSLIFLRMVLILIVGPRRDYICRQASQASPTGWYPKTLAKLFRYMKFHPVRYLPPRP
jgi:MFS family permease